MANNNAKGDVNRKASSIRGRLKFRVTFYDPKDIKQLKLNLTYEKMKTFFMKKIECKMTITA
jgi:hypothetical protein